MSDAPAQAPIAGAALRRAGDADAIADLHAPHLGADGLDDADAAVALDDRHVVHLAHAGRRRERDGRRRGRSGRRLEAEHGAHVRVAEVRGLGADHDLAAADRPQRHLLRASSVPAPSPREIHALKRRG